MIEYQNTILGTAVIMLIYIGVRLWHATRVNAILDSCEICDSKRKIRIKRGVFIRLLPFSTRKEFCKNCRNKYIILIIFKTKIVIFYKENRRFSRSENKNLMEGV